MKFPPLVKKGSKIRIVAPSGRLPNRESIEPAISTLKEWGFVVEIGKHVFDDHNTFAASDSDRLEDLQAALDDTSVDALLCARGGYGMTRILDELNLDNYLAHPKWVIGYSDITAFLLHAHHLNSATIHGPMGTSFGREGGSESIQALKQLLFRGELIIDTKRAQLRAGHAKGQLVGGNLAMICDSLGTPSELNPINKILILEDVGEHYYRIDRMLTQLKRAGKLSNLAALILGSFSSIKDGEIPFGEKIEEMVNRLTNEFDYPIAIGVPVGHEPSNFPFVFGGEYELEVSSSGAKLKLKTKL